MDSKPRLGRGLTALIGEAPAGDGASEAPIAGRRVMLAERRVLADCQVNSTTGSLCRSKVRRGSPVAGSQRRTDLSALPEAVLVRG